MATQINNAVIIQNINPNIKIVAERVDQYYSFALGLFINHGSRDEDKEHNGITHLIEHMLFKGTLRKSALEIVRMIEGFGGSFDAFTTKENLIIITRFLSEHFIKVFDLITEILLESKFGEDEFVREKSVILEEIKSNNEDPAEYIYDLLFEAVFKKHTMGMPIAGTIDSVSALKLEDVQRHYHNLLNYPMVIAVSGNFDFNTFFESACAKFPGGKLVLNERVIPTFFQPKDLSQTRNDISQFHLTLGIPGVAYSSELRHSVLLVSTMLGGGMSSRLFQGLREEQGLVYDIHSFVDFYSDCGLFGFYLNADKKNLNKIVKQLKKIFAHIHKNGFSREEIEIAKTYITGNLMLSLENSTNRMLRIGREILYLDRTTPVEEIVKKIKAIDEDEVNSLIADFLDLKRYSIAEVGPLEEQLVKTIADELRG